VIVGAGTGEGLTPTAEKMRRLMHYGQMFQSHSLHFFHLASPDLLFGIEADPNIRNIIGVAMEHRDLAIQGINMRKYGQEIIQATAGKKVHGTGAIPGGINKRLTPETVEHFMNGPEPQNISKMIEWSLGALNFFKDYHKKNRDLIDNFASYPSSSMSLVRKDGALDLYHGVLRAVDENGEKILHDIDYQEYAEYIGEEVKSWSYMKFPFLKHMGKEKGWYRVGPLARMNTADFIPTPLAQKEFEEFKAYTNGKPNGMTMHNHWARLIEILHSAEVMKELLESPEITEGELVVKGDRQETGIGMIEAPRGTLIHHYDVNEQDQITMANLIVSTTHNNKPMNKAVDMIAREYMTGRAVISEGMTNAVEVGIRAYDPCLSCATHAMGQMPLDIQIIGPDGDILDRKVRD